MYAAKNEEEKETKAMRAYRGGKGGKVQYFSSQKMNSTQHSSNWKLSKSKKRHASKSCVCVFIYTSSFQLKVVVDVILLAALTFVFSFCLRQKTREGIHEHTDKERERDWRTEFNTFKQINLCAHTLCWIWINAKENGSIGNEHNDEMRLDERMNQLTS